MAGIRARAVVLVLSVVVASGVVAQPSVAAPAYSVTLAAAPTTLEVGEHSTLTTTANRDLTGTRYTTYLFDQTDPSWYRTCKVQSCSFEVTQSTPGSRSYIAYIARERPDPRYPPMQVQATSNTVTVTWTAPTFTVTLAADRTWLPPGSTSILRATANKDMAGRPFALQIFDLTSGERIAFCTSGTTCSGPVTETTVGTRTFQAFVAEPGASPPPPNVQASSNVVSVTWSILPDPSRPPNVGGGNVTGDVTFLDGTGVPPVGADCAATKFDFEGGSDSAWVNGSGTAYIGPITIRASGGAVCETATTGDGALTVTAFGTSELGELECGPLLGRYTRVASDVTVIVTGDCVINNFPAVRIGFVAKGEFLPSNDGGGLTEPVTAATFTGAFTIVPA